MVYTERAETVEVSCGTSHVSAVNTPLRRILKNALWKVNHSHRITYVCISLFESGEQRSFGHHTYGPSALSRRVCACKMSLIIIIIVIIIIIEKTALTWYVAKCLPDGRVESWGQLVPVPAAHANRCTLCCSRFTCNYTDVLNKTLVQQLEASTAFCAVTCGIVLFAALIQLFKRSLLFAALYKCCPL